MPIIEVFLLVLIHIKPWNVLFLSISCTIRLDTILLLLLLLDYDCSCHPPKQCGLAMSCWKTTFYIPLRKVVILRVKLLKDAKNPSSLKRKTSSEKGAEEYGLILHHFTKSKSTYMNK